MENHCASKITLESFIAELKELKQERIEDLQKLNAKRDILVEFIAELNHLINEAEGNSEEG